LLLSLVEQTQKATETMYKGKIVVFEEFGSLRLLWKKEIDHL
jgi:hypothetical protein